MKFLEIGNLYQLKVPLPAYHDPYSINSNKLHPKQASINTGDLIMILDKRNIIIDEKHCKDIQALYKEKIYWITIADYLIKEYLRKV